jgi:isoleucyl-tRNA synthetase
MVYKIENYTHRYPVCWRCDSEVIFRLVDEWFIKMGELRFQIMEVAKQVNWIPDFGLQRELDWLENMQDWCISKKRYWGLALPIYDCSCGKFDVIGSKEELKSRAVSGWDKFDGHTPHRPWIDDVKIKCSACGEEMSRILDVGNPWLDAGIVPYSTMNYISNRKYWEEWFPADFITECFPGQFRNWFYAILAMSTVLENRTPFKTLLGHALVKDEHGEDMHKSSGNVIWFEEAAEKMGADIMRWIFTSHNPQENLNFGYTAGHETKRKILTLWNVYSFFVTYAKIDLPQIKPSSPDALEGLALTNLDAWILSKLQKLTQSIRERWDAYDPAPTIKHISDFIEDLSGWYVRRNRRRFWKPGADEDKLAAYQTLYECLVTLTKLIAPIMPFFAEELYQNLVVAIDPNAAESVHLTGFPDAQANLRKETLETETELVRELISLGLAARKSAEIKVRQPLANSMMLGLSEEQQKIVEKYNSIFTEELNIRKVSFAEKNKVLADNFVKSKDETGADQYQFYIDTSLTKELENEGLARELVHKIQNLRKTAGFDVVDRIEFYYEASDKLSDAINSYDTYIAQEVLAVKMDKISLAKEVDIKKAMSINGEPVTISLKRIILQG